MLDEIQLFNQKIQNMKGGSGRAKFKLLVIEDLIFYGPGCNESVGSP